MWKVHVPSGKWMAGVHTFKTLTKAKEFMSNYDELAWKTKDNIVRWNRQDNHFYGEISIIRYF